MGRCSLKNRHQKEIGPCAQNLLTILGSVVNIIGGGDVCGLLMAYCQWTLIIYNNLRCTPKHSGMNPGYFRYVCGCTKISTLQICVVLGNKEQKVTK